MGLRPPGFGSTEGCSKLPPIVVVGLGWMRPRLGSLGCVTVGNIDTHVCMDIYIYNEIKP